ncbi:uncharacterized protein UHOD_11740 [Ustilago sp. UG-2017b]|nr:uncharacterized protein UHOD_11740 [Ustilago sp. UG-2017b]
MFAHTVEPVRWTPVTAVKVFDMRHSLTFRSMCILYCTRHLSSLHRPRIAVITLTDAIVYWPENAERYVRCRTYHQSRDEVETIRCLLATGRLTNTCCFELHSGLPCAQMSKRLGTTKLFLSELQIWLPSRPFVTNAHLTGSGAASVFAVDLTISESLLTIS